MIYPFISVSGLFLPFSEDRQALRRTDRFRAGRKIKSRSPDCAGSEIGPRAGARRPEASCGRTQGPATAVSAGLLYLHHENRPFLKFDLGGLKIPQIGQNRRFYPDFGRFYPDFGRFGVFLAPQNEF